MYINVQKRGEVDLWQALSSSGSQPARRALDLQLMVTHSRHSRWNRPIHPPCFHNLWERRTKPIPHLLFDTNSCRDLSDKLIK